MFTPRRDINKIVGSMPEMKTYIGNVAEEAAREVESRLPHPRILGGIKVTSETKMGADGWEGEVRVAGHGWHLYEWGSVNNGPKPALRPGVQAVLSRFGGRFKSSD
jgi:hypothetical protein